MAACDRLNQSLIAAQEEAVAIRETLRKIGRYARSAESRTFDQCIDDLMMIDDLCREVSHDPAD